MKSLLLIVALILIGLSDSFESLNCPITTKSESKGLSKNTLTGLPQNPDVYNIFNRKIIVNTR